MLAFHRFADLFPLLQDADFADLVADVRQYGMREKVKLLDGEILDGRNRYRAAVAAELVGEDDSPEDHPGIFERFVREVDGDPLAYVISRNLKRRHLSDDQRRMVAAKLANMGRGRPAENPAECGIKVAEAARMVNVDEAGTERARTVIANAAPEIQNAVERGKLSVAAAAQAAKLEPEKQRRVAEEAEAGHTNAVRTVIKKETRAVREQTLGEKQAALPTQKFGVILADPEWRFEPWSLATGMDRAADNHYPTSCTEVIAARDVPSIAADDCVLFLWATAPMLPHALLVMAAWGFDYRSQVIWQKIRPSGEAFLGTGYWFRNAHELLLVGVKGSIPAPAMGTQEPSIIEAPIGEHSAKPEEFLQMIEQYFPTLPKIELNRRGPARPGWSAWGNESESEHAAGLMAPTASEPACATPPPSKPPAHAGSLDIPECLRRRAPV